MKMTTLMAALAVILTFAQGAQARQHYPRHGAASPSRFFDSAPAAFETWNSSPSEPSLSATSKSGYGTRPRAWCGWEMRQLVGGDPGAEYNLASNWAHWGRAGPLGVGAVVVWPHHVGKIVGQENGQWIIQSGNDGNRVRTRPLSISGAIAIRWG